MLSATCVYSDFKKAVYVDISPTEKYTVVAYRVYTMFYDNQAKTEHKIEIGNCTSAFFTPNELYLILFTQTTMFIYSISTGEIIGSESKGALVCKPVIYNDTVFFCVRRKYNHTVFQYDIINGTLIPRQMNSYKCGRPYESLWGDENKGIVQTWTTPTLNAVWLVEIDRDKYPMVIGHSELSFDKFVNYCLVPFDERVYAVSERKDGWYSFCYKVLPRRSFYGFKFPEGTDKLIAIDHSDDNIFFAMQNAVYICDKDIADVLFKIDTKKCTRFSVCSNVDYFMIKDNDKLKLYRIDN